MIAQRDEVASLLTERGCTVAQAATVPDALGVASTEAPFDVVVLAESFETLADPVNDLQALGKLVTEDGHVIVVAPNATHARVRMQALRGVVAGRQYDLAALERALAEAGLAPVERLRVIEPVPSAELDALAPGLAGLMSDAGADTATYVLVATRGAQAPAGETVAEALQRTIASLNAEVDELQSARAALADAEATIAEQALELDARRAALEERIELVERLYAERRHLELEIVVKDDYISILRRDRNDWRNLHGAVQYELDDLRRSRHYKVAAGMHKALTRVPLLPRLARFAARRLMAARGRGA